MASLFSDLLSAFLHHSHSTPSRGGRGEKGSHEADSSRTPGAREAGEAANCTSEWETFASKMLLIVSSEMWREDRSS